MQRNFTINLGILRKDIVSHKPKSERRLNEIFSMKKRLPKKIHTNVSCAESVSNTFECSIAIAETTLPSKNTNAPIAAKDSTTRST